MIVSDRRSQFGKMIVSDRRSQKKVLSLTLAPTSSCECIYLFFINHWHCIFKILDYSRSYGDFFNSAKKWSFFNYLEQGESKLRRPNVWEKRKRRRQHHCDRWGKFVERKHFLSLSHTFVFWRCWNVTNFH